MLVSDPEAVKVDQFSEDDGTLVLELSVGDHDPPDGILAPADAGQSHAHGHSAQQGSSGVGGVRVTEDRPA